MGSMSATLSSEMTPIIDGIVASGITDNANIAEALNRRGVPTARGDGRGFSVSVARIRERRLAAADRGVLADPPRSLIDDAS